MRQDIRAGRAYVELFVKNNQFVRGLRRAKEQLRQFGSDMQALGRTMAAASAGMLLPIGFAVRGFAAFDDKMREVAAVSQATGRDFDKLTAKAKQLGASTSFTAVQVAALMAELGRAGFSPAQIEDMTGAVLDLARATSTDATQASGIMAASIRQFGLAAGDATRVADALTAAANKSFNTVESLGESLSYAGPVAADFNMSIEETLAILGALGNVGIQGSNAGTAIRRLLTLTGAQAEKLNKIFGVSFRDSAGNARPLVDVLDEVNQATKSLGTGERAAKFNEAFGLLGITSASAISKNAASAKELLTAIEGAGGIAKKTAADMDAGLGGAFRILRSAIEGVGIAIGEALNDEVTSLVKRFTGVATAAIDWIKANRELVTTIVKVAAGVGVAGVALIGLGGIMLGLSSVIGGVLSALSFVGAIASAIASPIGLLVAAAVAAGAAWFDFSNASQMAAGIATKSFQFMRDNIIPAVQATVAFVQSAWQTVVDYVGPMVSAFAVSAESAFTALLDAAKWTWNQIGGVVTATWDVVTSVTGTVLSWLQTAVITSFSAITFAIKQWQLLLEIAVQSAAVSIVSFGNELIHLFTVAIPGYLSWFGNHWREVFTDVVNFTATVATNIWKNITNLWDAIANFFSGNGFTFEWTPLTEGFRSAISELPKIAEREIGPVEKALRDRLDDLSEDLAGAWGKHQKDFSARIAPAEVAPEIARISQARDEIKEKEEQRAEQAARQQSATPSSGEMSNKVFGTFSAAALMAQTGSRSPMARMEKGIENVADKVEQGNKFAEKVLDELRLKLGVVV